MTLWLAVADQAFKDMIDKAYPVCEKLIQSCKYVKGLCVAAADECNAAVVEPISVEGARKLFNGTATLNPYDIRTPCDKPPLCYDFGNADEFLGSPATLAKLGANPKIKWEECNMKVHGAMMGDWMSNLEVRVVVHDTLEVNDSRNRAGE